MNIISCSNILSYWSGKKQGRNEFVIRLQPSEAMYMKLTVSNSDDIIMRAVSIVFFS